MSDFEKLEQTVGGIYGLMTCIPAASDALGLNNEQVIAFCDATPNGEELWRQFTARRDSNETPNDYNFTSFMTEVLAKTNHPVTSETQLFQGASLDQQLLDFGQQRRSGESDWDYRRRVFPAVFNRDQLLAYEILVGKESRNFNPTEAVLFEGLAMGKNRTKDELEKFGTEVGQLIL